MDKFFKLDTKRISKLEDRAKEITLYQWTKRKYEEMKRQGGQSENT